MSQVPVPRPDDDGTERWAREAALAANDKLGADTVVFRVGEVLAVADLFVITSAPNTRQVRAITEEVEHRITTTSSGSGATPPASAGRARLPPESTAVRASPGHAAGRLPDRLVAGAGRRARLSG